MNIAVPIAAYEEGTTGEYVVRAFRQLGHQARTLSQWEFYDAFRADCYDLYFCVDSGGPLNLTESSINDGPWGKLAFWMIDYRRGKTLKNPNDDITCHLVSSRGGYVFQAQWEDYLECRNKGFERTAYLPLAADPDVWSNEPTEEKKYAVGFIGNVWDWAREQLLTTLRSRYGDRLGWPGHGGARMEAAARILRQSQIGFNVSSFFTEPIAYDVNMRVFETLSCGVPLVTNYVPALKDLELLDAPFVRTYRDALEAERVIEAALLDQQFLESGPAARQWILGNATYKMRMQEVMDGYHRLSEQGVVSL